MMVKKKVTYYRADIDDSGEIEISKFRVMKESDKTIWLEDEDGNSRRMRKNTEGAPFASKSEKEALKSLIDRIKKTIEYHKNRIKSSKEKVEELNETIEEIKEYM